MYAIELEGFALVVICCVFPLVVVVVVAVVVVVEVVVVAVVVVFVVVVVVAAAVVATPATGSLPPNPPIGGMIFSLLYDIVILPVTTELVNPVVVLSV